MKYRKKPVIIEAIKFVGGDENILEIMKLSKDRNRMVQVENGGKSLFISTLEGKMEADLGDWIIQGVKGEIYPCKPDIFEQTYEAVKVEVDDENS